MVYIGGLYIYHIYIINISPYLYIYFFIFSLEEVTEVVTVRRKRPNHVAFKIFQVLPFSKKTLPYNVKRNFFY